MAKLEIIGCENCNLVECDEQETVWGIGQAEAIPDWLRESNCPRCHTLFSTIELIFVEPTLTNTVKREHVKAATAEPEMVSSLTATLIPIWMNYDTSKQQPRNVFV